MNWSISIDSNDVIHLTYPKLAYAEHEPFPTIIFVIGVMIAIFTIWVYCLFRYVLNEELHAKQE